MLSRARQYEIIFQKKEQIAPDVYTLYFSKPDDFSFLAGQYLRFTIPHQPIDQRGSWRYFTISSSPLDPYIMITTRINAPSTVIPDLIRDPKKSVTLDSRLRENDKGTMIQVSTFKHTLMHLSGGDTVTVFGPMGILYLQDDDRRDKVFLSRGLGITPFYSILRYAAQAGLTQSLTLIASFSYVDGYLFEDELAKIHTADNHMQAHFTTESQPVAILGEEIPLNPKAQYVITGALLFIEQTWNAVHGLGIPAEQILTEEFTGYA